MKLDTNVAAIVTGGASGLGEATARMLSSHGVKEALFELNAERGRQGRFRDRRSLLQLRCDRRGIDRRGAGAARAAHGVERVLINCAGIAPARRTVSKNRETGAFVAHDFATFTRTIQINLIGTFQMIAKSAVAMATLSPVTEMAGAASS